HPDGSRMADGAVSTELQAFLYERISSYDQLEVLLLVRHDGKEWNAEAVSVKLNIAASAALAALEELCEAGLLKSSGSGKSSAFVYVSDNAKLEATLSLLAREYEDNRLEIVRVMTRNAIDRVRNQAVTTFAEAFVLGKGKKDG